MDIKELNKKGQMMIWVIVALGLVIIIIIFFLFRGGVVKPGIEERVEEDPRGFISDCTERYADESVDIMLPQGGFIEPEHAKMYEGINVSYLCYNSGNYNPCINEHPLLVNEIKNEMKDYIVPRVEQCFNDYKTEIEKRQGKVDLGTMALGINFAPDRIFVSIDRDVNLRIKEQSYNYNKFDIEMISPVYNLARVAMEIASQEAKYCYFEYVGYMILYPEFKIERDILSDYSEIYSIEDKKSGKKMNIAVRSCAIPPGL